MTLALLIIAASIATTIIGFVVIGSLRRVARWVRRSRDEIDPLSEPHGDVVNVGRHPLGPQS